MAHRGDCGTDTEGHLEARSRQLCEEMEPQIPVTRNDILIVRLPSISESDRPPQENIVSQQRITPPRSSTLDPERNSPCAEQYSAATMTNEQGIFTKIKESSLSISLTAALILVASIVVIISSITIQSAYMWLAVGATAVLFLGFCSCTTCEKSSHFHFRRGSIHSDSVSTISDGRDNFYEVGHLQNTPPYWIADLPPSYAVATATSMAPDCQLPPPYSAVADVHAPLRVYSDVNKPATGEESPYIGDPPPPPPPAVYTTISETVATAEDAESPLHVPSTDPRASNRNNRTDMSAGTEGHLPLSRACDACEGPC